jgi:hypothetical protein
MLLQRLTVAIALGMGLGRGQLLYLRVIPLLKSDAER